MTNVSTIVVPPFRFGKRALFIRPGISWDDWQRVWQTAEGMHQSSTFYVGDALLAGQREFGERFAQVVDAKYVNQQRGAMWVCSRIEPERRKSNCSYSLHRELAAMEPDEQDRWLAMASEGSWTVKALKEAMVSAGLRGNGGPPLDDRPTRNDSGTFGTLAEMGEPPVLVSLEGGKTAIEYFKRRSPAPPSRDEVLSGIEDVYTLYNAAILPERTCDVMMLGLFALMGKLGLDEAR